MYHWNRPYSCISIIHQSLKSPSFTPACSRCDKTTFLGVLVTTVTVSLAQVVIMLRFVFFGMGGFMLITTEWNRIYAVTKKNRMIASCFFVITISQFALGLYQVAYTATRGGESVTGCCPWFLPIMFQRNPSHQSHFWFTWYAFCAIQVPANTGGEGIYNQWIHCDLIVIF